MTDVVTQRIDKFRWGRGDASWVGKAPAAPAAAATADPFVEAALAGLPEGGGWTVVVPTSARRPVEKFNPFHDSLGQFTVAGVGGGAAAGLRSFVDEHWSRSPTAARPTQPMNPKQVAAVDRYTLQDSHAVNRWYRHGDAEAGASIGVSLQQVRATAGLLDSALALSHFDQPVTLYRGLEAPGLRRDMLGKIRAGQEIGDYGYASTSFDRGQAEGYRGKDGVVVEIRHADGMQALPVNFGKTRSEVILPRGSVFRVVEVRPDDPHVQIVLETMPKRLGLSPAIPVGG